MLPTIRVRMRPRTPLPWPRRGATAGDFARCSSDWRGRVGAVPAWGRFACQGRAQPLSSRIRGHASAGPGFFGPSAAIAQLVEHLIRNEGVGGSSPSCGTIKLLQLNANGITRLNRPDNCCGMGPPRKHAEENCIHPGTYTPSWWVGLHFALVPVTGNLPVGNSRPHLFRMTEFKKSNDRSNAEFRKKVSIGNPSEGREELRSCLYGTSFPYFNSSKITTDDHHVMQSR